MKPIAIICSEFNKDLVELLYQSAQYKFESLKQYSLNQTRANKNKQTQVIQNQLEQTQTTPDATKSCDFNLDLSSYQLNKIWVPGAAEIPLACQWILDKKQAQAVLALGVIIKGQTSHFDFLSGFLQKALWDMQKSYRLPIVFSALFLDNRSQFKKRVVRAAEGMQALLKMLNLQSTL